MANKARTLSYTAKEAAACSGSHTDRLGAAVSVAIAIDPSVTGSLDVSSRRSQAARFTGERRNRVIVIGITRGADDDTTGR